MMKFTYADSLVAACRSRSETEGKRNNYNVYTPVEQIRGIKSGQIK